MELSVQALKNAMAAVTAPVLNDAEDYRIAASLGQAFVARARSSAPTMLVPLPVVPAGVGRRGGGFSLTPTSRVAFDFDGRRWEQPAAALECTDLRFVDAFLVLVVDIALRLKAGPGEITWSTLLAWVDEWQALLGRRSVMTPEQILGLWGELWILSKAAAPDSLIGGWRGPDREAIDFLYDGVGLEVKVSRKAHVHYVSQRQVDSPVGAHDSYLLSLWVAPEPVRGVSVAELVDSLLARVSDGPALLRQVALTGYSVVDRDHYSVRYVPLEPPRWFRAEDVPRVRTIDPGVSQLRYVVSLDIDSSLDPAVSDGLWRHFCQGLPSAALATDYP
jgi:hypothetical protein